MYMCVNDPTRTPPYKIDVAEQRFDGAAEGSPREEGADIVSVSGNEQFTDDEILDAYGDEPDFVDEVIAESTAINPDFPAVLERARLRAEAREAQADMAQVRDAFYGRFGYDLTEIDASHLHDTATLLQQAADLLNALDRERAVPE